MTHKPTKRETELMAVLRAEIKRTQEANARKDQKGTGLR